MRFCITKALLLRHLRSTAHSRPRARLPGSYHHEPFFCATRSLAQLRQDSDASLGLGVAFTRTGWKAQEPEPGQRQETPKPDERTLKLGKTLRILQARLPNLLATPLPQEILAPSISLHLFPSTHPHLPTVSGRVAYHAALWTSPITWGRVPLVGNVHLDIQSERMVKEGGHIITAVERDGSYKRYSSEKLIVRWRTCGKTKGLGTGANYKGIGTKQTVDKITFWLGGSEKRDDEEFCGLFIFEFDDEGRIVRHVIERTEGGEGWDNGMGKVVGLTDWLLGRFGKGFLEQPPGLALGYECAPRHGGRSRQTGSGGS